jgi:hypothetical protein
LSISLFLKDIGIIIKSVAVKGSTLSEGFAALGVSFSNLAAGIGISTTALGSFLGVAAGIAVVAGGIALYNKYWDNLNESADEASETYKSMASEMDTYKSRITELKASLASGNLSQEESYEVRKELLSIQDEIIDKYGEEAEGLNLLAQSADEANASLDGITKTQALENLNDKDNRKAYNKAVEKMEEGHDYSLNFSSAMGNSYIRDAVNSIVKSYDNVSIESPQAGQYFIKVTGDTSEAQAALKELYDSVLLVGDDKYQYASNLADGVKAMLDPLGAAITASLFFVKIIIEIPYFGMILFGALDSGFMNNAVFFVSLAKKIFEK